MQHTETIADINRMTEDEMLLRADLEASLGPLLLFPEPKKTGIDFDDAWVVMLGKHAGNGQGGVMLVLDGHGEWRAAVYAGRENAERALAERRKKWAAMPEPDPLTDHSELKHFQLVRRDRAGLPVH